MVVRLGGKSSVVWCVLFLLVIGLVWCICSLLVLRLIGVIREFMGIMITLLVKKKFCVEVVTWWFMGSRLFRVCCMVRWVLLLVIML